MFPLKEESMDLRKLSASSQADDSVQISPNATGSPCVVVTDHSVDVQRLRQAFTVVQFTGEGAMPRALFLKYVLHADALFVMVRDKVDKELMDAAKNLKVVSTMSVGFDHIDIDECKKRNVVVTNTPDVLTETTAEMTVALLLATARRIPEGVEEVKRGRWGTWEPYYMCGVGVMESTVGIIGLGRIGCSVVEKLKAFHPRRILYTDVKPNAKRAEEVGAAFVPMEELVKESDFVIMTCSMTNSNRGFMNKELLSKMKHNAVLINTSRGALLNHGDLYEALSGGRLRAAGLDVTDPEPFPTDHPLLKLPNCVITPHIASATWTTRKRMEQLTIDGILAVIEHLDIPHAIRVV